MPKFIRFLGGVVLTGVLLALTACDGPPPKAPQFNDRIAKNNEKWNAAVVNFRNAIEPLSKGTAVAPGTAQQAYDNLLGEFKTVKKASRHMPTPLYNQPASEFLQKYQDYLDGQDQLLQNEVKQVVGVVGNGAMAPGDKWRQIWALYLQIASKEQPAKDAMLKAQRDFAKLSNLSVPTGGGGPQGPMGGMPPR